MGSLKATRKLDGLGRVVIPIDLRRRMGIEPGNNLLIEFNNNQIILKTPDTSCAICGSTDHVLSLGEAAVCRSCAKKIKDAMNKSGE